MNSYELSRNFTDWCFDNPHKVKPIHYAIFYFSIEHCNRLGWKENFGFPSQMVMEAIGVKNWRTYSSGLNDLAEFGFIKIIEKSQNQYSSNIIAIVNFTKAHTKPLDKALSNHHTNHSQTTVSIDKQDNNKQLNNIISFNYKKCSDKELVEELSKFKETYSKDILNSFYRYWSEKDDKGKMKMSLEKTFEVDKRLITWSTNDKKFNKVENKIDEKKIIW